jgi:hypothetical protein
MTDTEHAERIMAAVIALTHAVQPAIDAGLSVEINSQDIARFNRPEPIRTYHAAIRRITEIA